MVKKSEDEEMKEMKQIFKELGMNKKDIDTVNLARNIQNGGKIQTSVVKGLHIEDPKLLKDIENLHKFAVKVDKDPFAVRKFGGNASPKKRNVSLKKRNRDMIINKFIQTKDVKVMERMLDTTLYEGVNVQNKNGETALINHAINGNVEAIQFLLSKHARVDIKDNLDNDALFYAKAKKCGKCVELLEKSNVVGSQVGSQVSTQVGTQVGDKPLSETGQLFSTALNLGVPLASMAGLIAIPTTYFFAFQVFSPILIRLLDQYANGQELEDSSLTNICKVIMYALPVGLIDLFIRQIYYDSDCFAVNGVLGFGKCMNVKKEHIETIKNTIDPSNAAEQVRIAAEELAKKNAAKIVNNNISSNPTDLAGSGGMLSSLKNAFVTLYGFAADATGATYRFHTDSAGNLSYSKVVLTMAIIYWMVKYLYTRLSGDKERNEELDRAIYSNHNHRIKIMEFQLRKAKREEADRQKQEFEYNKKVDEKLEEYFSENKKGDAQTSAQALAAAASSPKGRWHKFDPNQADDDKYYLFNQSVQKTKSKTKTSSSTRRRRRKIPPEDGVVLENLEKMIKNENKS